MASVVVLDYGSGNLRSAEKALWEAARRAGSHAEIVTTADPDYVARAEVDAGFVYATDAALMPDKVRVAFTVPTAEPVRYPAAALAASPRAESARQFVDFLVSPPAQAVLGRHGFSQP